MNNAETLIQALKDNGTKTIFGYTGGVILPAFRSLEESGIELVVNTNELGSGYAANGYSRSNGGVGVALVTSGPGIGNTFNAVNDAYCDSIPMIVISGQVPTARLGTDAFQYLNVPDVFSHITKKTYQPSVEDDLAHLVHEAFLLATSGKPGPVVIDLPLDVQNAEAVGKAHHPIRQKEHPVSEMRSKEFFDMLAQAKRPLMYIGGGLNSQEGSRAARAFSSRFGIPIVNTLMAKGVVAPHDPLNLGMLGMYGTPYANKAVQEADFFFALGVRWDDRVVSKVGAFGPNAKIAYVDINPDKVAQIMDERNPEFTHVGSADEALDDLVAYARKQPIDLDIQEWREYVADLKDRWRLDFDRQSGKLQQAHVLEVLDRFIDGDTIITTGVGNHQMIAANYLNPGRPQSFLTSGSLGDMDFAIPAAIGAHYANPDLNIIAIMGDGSYQMLYGEQLTIIKNNLPIKLLVMNNGGERMVTNVQDEWYGRGHHTGTDEIGHLNYARIAQAMGFAYARRIDSKDHLSKDIYEFWNAKGPAFLEVMVDPEELVRPRIPFGGDYSDMVTGPFIYDRKA